MNWSNDDGEIEELDEVEIAQSQADYEHAKWDEEHATDNLKTESCDVPQAQAESTPEIGHTPEPWSVDGDGGAVWIQEVASGRGHKIICDMALDGEAEDEDKANAWRIVAAINATAGIPTEALENGVVAELLAACETFSGYDGYSRNVPEGFTALLLKAKHVSA